MADHGRDVLAVLDLVNDLLRVLYVLNLDVVTLSRQRTSKPVFKPDDFNYNDKSYNTVDISFSTCDLKHVIRPSHVLITKCVISAATFNLSFFGALPCFLTWPAKAVKP